MAETSIFGRR